MNDNQKQIVKNSVKGLQEFGYPDVNENNIFTDMIYSAFFKRMLQNAKGQGYDSEIDELLNKIDN